MGPQESDTDTTKCRLSMPFKFNTPVFGCKINPIIRVIKKDDALVLPPHKLSLTWYREQVISSLDQEKIRCSVHFDRYATFQCIPCVTLNLSVKGSYHCSTGCFLDAWKKHEVHHRHAAEMSETLTENLQAVKNIGSYVSWPDFEDDSSHNETAIVLEREGKTWIKVGTSNSYVPTQDDIGFSLRLECVVVDCSMDTHLSPVHITVTNPVIYPPAHPSRCMIKCVWGPWESNLKAQSSKDVTFSVLSYNILAELYAFTNDYSYCPEWARSWEYRKQNLLNEIIEYDADILCLQEVQRDHFENFLKPELAKCGYSVIYKKKTKEVFTYNEYIADGCATFYRHDQFKEIVKYELEFDKSAKPFVEALEPALRNQGSFRLLKDNVALVVIFEIVDNESSCDRNRPRICVANTHIHASEKFPEVKLFQVATLINGLEKIAKSKIPLLICADLNSLPLSDPHRFISKGRLDSVPNKETDPFGICQTLKLYHSVPVASAYACFCQSDGIEEKHYRKMDSETKEPLFTNFTSRFIGTLDYIFYTANSLRLESVLDLLDQEAVGPGLPSPRYSSDHIALMGRFTLEPSSYKDTFSEPIPPNPWQQAAAA